MEQSLKRHKVVPLWQGPIVKTALVESFKKLDPRHLAKNPVMFVVEVGSAVTTWFWVQGLRAGAPDAGFAGHITLWLWFTVLFANFAEAMAEGRGKAQAETLRRTKTDTAAKRLRDDGTTERVGAAELRKGDVVLVEAGDVVPADGEVVDGIASVDESAVTGESAPVIRESGGDRSSVTGGTKVNSDWIKVRVTANPGEGFLDKMIALVEGAERQKTPNEIALNILLAGLTLIFLVVLMSLQAFAIYSGGAVSVVTLVALLVCLIPTTIGGLLSAIGIAGIDRLMQSNVLAMSGRAVEAAGDVDCLLLDKTGTITLGNRMASEFVPAPGVSVEELALDAQLSSLSDETPEGRSIVVLAKSFVPKPTGLHDKGMIFVPFTAQTRLSGVDIGPVTIRKGAVDAVAKLVDRMPPELTAAVERISKSGGTPLAVARDGKARGVIHLKDVVKGGIRQRFEQLRAAGIRTVMITGDHPLTATAIARRLGILEDGGGTLTGPELEALSLAELRARARGVSVYARVAPEQKLKIVTALQEDGEIVAMTGDGVNDAPALRRADIGVAMGLTGTDAAKQAAAMVLLDDDFATIVGAVREGRRLYDNIRRFVKYQLTTNSAEVLVVALAPLFGLPIPLLPVQILWINLLTDGLPGLALAAEPEEAGAMTRGPRPPDESVLARGLGLHAVWVGLLMTALVLGVQWALVGAGSPHWRTLVFTVVALSQLGHVLAIRSETESLFAQGLLSNKPLLAAVAATALLQAAAVYAPPLRALLKTTPLTAAEAGWAFAASTLVFWAVEAEKWLKRRARAR